MDGMNFTRWKEKMKFLLTALIVYYVLKGPQMGVLTEEEQKKCDHDETLCRGYNLSTITDQLTTKEMTRRGRGTWNSSNDNKKDKKPLFEVVYYKCGEKGHIKRYCKNPKKKNQYSNNKDESANALEQVDTTEITAMLTRGGNRSFITFIDDCSRYTYVYLLKSKDQAFETFKIYKAEVENQRGKKIQILSSDRGGEYFSTEFSSYCESQSLIHQRTTSYTPQQNSVVERKNRVFQDMINAIVWGCLVYYKVPLPNTSKLGSRGLKSVFVGYARDSKSYRCLDLDSNVIVESRDVTQILQDISGLDLNSNNKRNMAESSSAPIRSEKARKERNLDLDFIDSHAIIFLVEDLDLNVIVESRDVDFFENKFCHDSTSTNEIVTQILQDIFGLDLNSNNKRNMAESSSVPMRSERARKERNLDLDFIDSHAIIFLVEDDILIVGTNMKGNNETKKFWSSCFQMKDMNEVDTILRIKVKRHSEGYALNHCHYIDKIIDKFQHLNIKEANIPYESSCKLVENDERVVAQIEYGSEIGYSDASWITGSSDSKSTTGWIFTLGGEAVCWGLKKQTCITHSTMKAEFLALATVGKEAEWLRNMLDIELWPQRVTAISLHCDSQSTLSRAYNKVYNG
uniref:Integrase catalytic domain-containing protein n=1 Tax=Tanacetum cinerariifolium TaxID=118510 RepID=A0A6L2NR36_TANCI|nr:hypothetical protein [Tanacetum cinerariifolium]